MERETMQRKDQGRHTALKEEWGYEQQKRRRKCTQRNQRLHNSTFIPRPSRMNIAHTVWSALMTSDTTNVSYQTTKTNDLIYNVGIN